MVLINERTMEIGDGPCVLKRAIGDSEERTMRSSIADNPDESTFEFKLPLLWFKWQGIGYPKSVILPDSDSVERVLLPGMTEFGRIPAEN